jgi:RNA polymerase sigma factor (sigma-70 family)
MQQDQSSRETTATAAVDDLSDGTLLERVATQRDEDAFAALVRRYGPIVLGVCRRVLRHEQDAEDAFQATFLVLFRQARSIRKRQSVGSWLYGVAYRVAQNARLKKARRSVRETALSDTPAAESTPAWMWQEVRALLDDEVNRLPAKYRLPFVLCHIEGKTNEQAAEQIGCPRGTVLSRLAWARERLRGRLTRRGLTLPAGLVTTVLAEQAVAVEIPARLANATVQAAVMFGSGQAGTVVKGITLAQGFLRAQLLRKWTKAVGLLAVGGLVAVLLLFLTRAQKPKTDQQLLQGTWKVAKMWFGGQEMPVEAIDMIFAGDQFTQRAAGTTLQASFRLDPGKDPKEIDFLFPRRVTWRGIYRLEGDHMLLCWNTEGPERPADFTGKRFYYYELRRQPEGQR